MTRPYYDANAPHIKWFRTEEARFYKEARLKAGLLLEQACAELGFDIGLVEGAEKGLPMDEIQNVLKLYSVPFEEYVDWQNAVSVKFREIKPETPPINPT